MDNETEIGKKVQESGVMSKGKSHRSWYGVVDGGQNWTCNILEYNRYDHLKRTTPLQQFIHF